jgi:anti-sigma factor RsiW
MSYHATAEALSAYLDEALRGPDLQALESHLVECDECQDRLNGMQRVVVALQQLERAAPPPALGIQLQRRVALEDRPRGLVERFEAHLQRLPRLEPTLLNGFARWRSP